MRGTRKTWLLPNNTGWDPDSYEKYFGTTLGATIRRREEKLVYEALGGFMKPGDSILEAGPGTGNYTVPVARRCGRVVAADSSPEMLRHLGDLVRRQGLANVEVRTAHLPDELRVNEEFDGVLTVGTLNYVEDAGRSLRSLAAVLKPGGWMVFTVPLSSPEGKVYALSEFANRRQIHLYSRKEAMILAEKAGLKAVTVAAAGLTRSGLTLVVGAVAPT